MKALRFVTALALCLLLTSLVYAQTKPVTRSVRKPAATRATTASKVAAKPTPATPVAPAKPAPPPPLATVNGSPITRDHLEQAIQNQWAAPMMRAMIEQRLIRQEARRVGLKLTPERIEAAAASRRAEYPSERAFQRHLEEQGLSQMAFTEKVTDDLLLESLMAGQNVVSDEDARKYYDAHAQDYGGSKELHLLAIVTTTVEDAYLARERLAGGDRFDVVAKELSVHESRDKGGDLGWVKREDLPDKALADAIFALDTNVVSNPLRAGSSYWIALVKEVQGKPAVSFEQAKAGILEKLQGEKKTTREEYLRSLARKANIQVNWAPVTYLTGEYRAYRNLRVIVDEKELDLDVAPERLPNGSIMAVAKPLLQAIGARLDWRAAEQTLTATTLAGRIKIAVGSTKAQVGVESTEVIDIREAPVMRAGLLWISPRPVLMALGCRVQWDPVANALIVTSPAQSVPPPTVPASRGGLEMKP